MGRMQRSMAARYVAWPEAHFPSSVRREGERRLGLNSDLRFRRAATSRTILRPSHGGLQATAWLPATDTARRTARSGVVRATVAIHWADGGRSRATRRSSLAPAPWRG